jgi:hypothetical protein
MILKKDCQHLTWMVKKWKGLYAHMWDIREQFSLAFSAMTSLHLSHVAGEYFAFHDMVPFFFPLTFRYTLLLMWVRGTKVSCVPIVDIWNSTYKLDGKISSRIISAS